MLHPGAEPFGPGLNAFAGGAGNLEEFNFGVDGLHRFGKTVGIKLDIR
jgi:hypothetical protein